MEMELPQCISLFLSTIGENTSPSSTVSVLIVLFCITVAAFAATSKNRAAIKKARLNTIFNIILLIIQWIKKEKYSPVDVVGLGLQEDHEPQDKQDKQGKQDKQDEKSTAKAIPFIKTKNRQQAPFSRNSNEKDNNATNT